VKKCPKCREPMRFVANDFAVGLVCKCGHEEVIKWK